jgi:hypothetical protein
MLVITIDLHSARTGKKTNLATLIIANEGGTETRGNYWGRVYRKGTSLKDWTTRKPMRKANVYDYARLTRPVWCLVTEMLINLGYGPKGDKNGGK